MKRLKRAVPDRIKAAVIRSIAGGRPGVVQIGSDLTLKYPLDDFYWSRAEPNIRSYEPEMWFVLERVLNPRSLFIDCGANIGLWSCFAAVKIGNGRQVVAIEPGFKVHPFLLQNCRENDLDFTVLNRAIWNKSGEQMTFFAYESHASSSLMEDGSKKILAKSSVETVCIDDLVERSIAKSPSISNFIVKLDVEGVECEAIAGAARTLARDNVLLIYEDHGHDRESRVTELCLRLGMQIYFHADGAMRPMSSRHDVDEVKKDSHRGYNFFACNRGSEFDVRLRECSDRITSAVDVAAHGLMA